MKLQTISVVAVMVGLGSGFGAVAQSFTPVRELKNLSPGAIAKLHTLETLNTLPAGQWRMHAGDLAHGRRWGWMIHRGQW